MAKKRVPTFNFGANARKRSKVKAGKKRGGGKKSDAWRAYTTGK